MGGGFNWQGGQGFGGGNPFEGFGFDFQNGGQGFSDMNGDLNDIFESFFEGLGVRPRRKTYERGADLEMVEEITLEEVFRGVTKELRLETLMRCETCKGQGADTKAGFTTCSVCGGQGEIKEHKKTFFGSFSQVKACGKCRGAGQIPNKICSTCSGAGRVKAVRNVRLEILAGIESEQLIKVNGAGEAGERGTASGDLYVRIRIRPHALFVRQGADLVVKKELKVIDLLLDRKVELSTISGGKIGVEIPAHFNLKDHLRVAGEGMPRFGARGRGDLLVDFIIKAPKKLSSKAKRILEELEKEE
jgi:molecular chaperone DnaJ